MDRDYGDVRPFERLYLAARRFLAKFEDKYVFKFFDDGSEVVEKELRMMILAGDCSVTPLGRGYSKKGNSLASSCRTKRLSFLPLPMPPTCTFPHQIFLVATSLDSSTNFGCLFIDFTTRALYMATLSLLISYCVPTESCGSATLLKLP